MPSAQHRVWLPLFKRSLIQHTDSPQSGGLAHQAAQLPERHQHAREPLTHVRISL
ncbi:hypothetical protein ACFPAF_15660 [Hymenobacter endophyticus]|uniref:Uncharacterized protein n=1 Tax=Hymenobacter endophyticus TaxID=3076335 RepID=A0ABU3TKE8_9BACT|nr:hypothetical protein [Hymenobacter endophyticus]MDU0371839.1 hypothetical protein [Hymenobacter endophyticus]